MSRKTFKSNSERRLIIDSLTPQCKSADCRVKSSQAKFIDGYCPDCKNENESRETQNESRLAHYETLCEGDFS